MNEGLGATVTDAVAGGFAGTFNTAKDDSDWVPGVTGRPDDFAVQFVPDSSLEGVLFGTDASFENVSEGTVMMWVKQNNPDPEGRVFQKGNDGVGYAFIGVIGNNQFVFESQNGTGNLLQPGLPVGEWFHIAVSWKVADNVKNLYVNGELAVSGGFNVPFNTKPSRPFVIGADPGVNIGRVFDGVIDELKVFNTFLTAQQVDTERLRTMPPLTPLVHYYPMNDGSGTAVADAVGGANGAFNSAKDDTDWVPGVTGKAEDFAVRFVPDNRNEGVLFGMDASFENVSEGTLMFWMKQNSADPEGRIFQKGNDGAGYSFIGIIGNNQFVFESQNGTGNLLHPGIPVGEWVHIAVSWKVADNVKNLYVNGALVATGSFNLPFNSHDDQPFVIGADPGVNIGRVFDGVIDELKIFNRFMTAQDVGFERFNTTPPLLPSPLHHYRMNEGSGATVGDAVAGGVNGTFNSAKDDTDWVPGVSGDVNDFAVRFVPDDRNEGALFGTDASFENVSEGTIMLWLKQNTADPEGRVFQKGNDGAGYSFIGIVGNNQFVFESQNGTGNLNASGLPVGRWTHIAVSWKVADNVKKLYVDGAEIASGPFNAPFNSKPSLPFVIGADPGVNIGRVFDGVIDELKLFNVFMTADQVAVERFRTEPAIPRAPIIEITQQPQNVTVSIGQSATFTVAARVINADPASLRYQWQLDRNDIPGATASSYTTPPVTVNDDLARYRSVVFIPDGPSVASDEAILEVTAPAAPASLIALYRFEETDPTFDQAADSSGNELHGTYEGGTLIDPMGRFGRAARFNGGAAHVRVPGDLRLTVKDLTLAFWLNSDLGDTDFSVLAQRGGGTWIAMLNQTSDPSQRTPRWAVGGVDFQPPTPVLTPGTWQHLAVVQRGKGARMYVNGNLVATGRNPGLARTPEPIRIGQRGAGIPGGDTTINFAGRIDEVAIFTNKLSQAEIQSHISSGVLPGIDAPVALWKFEEQDTSMPAVDSSGNGLNGTYMGGVSLVEGPPSFGNALRLDGRKGSMVLIPGSTLFDSDRLTVEFWLWIPLAPEYLGPGAPITRTPDSGANTPWLFQTGGGDSVSARWISGGGGFLEFVGFSREAWHHVAITHEGDSAQLYVNGQLVREAAVGALPVGGDVHGGVQELLIGGRRSDGLSGMLDEFALFEGTLMQAEIQAQISQGVQVRPRLAIEREGATVKISWPASLAGFQLQETMSLSAPNWMDVNQAVQQNGGRNVVTLSIGNQNRYFRLRSQ